MSPELVLLIVVGAPLLLGAGIGGLAGYWLGERHERRRHEGLDFGFIQISGRVTAAHRDDEGPTTVDAIELDTVDYMPPAPHLRAVDGSPE